MGDFRVRLARMEEAAALEELIYLSVRALQGEYTEAQREAALGSVFGVDRQLIEDGTYFVVETEGLAVACGGWSQRKSLYGKQGAAELLDPAADPARIRAFYVHPDWARRGIGTLLLEACETAARAAGFRRFTMGATLAGEKLYARHGYAAEERIEVELGGGEHLTVIRMEKG